MLSKMFNEGNLTCRTCLQVTSSCVGLFEHYEREKLLSDILMKSTKSLFKTVL